MKYNNLPKHMQETILEAVSQIGYTTGHYVRSGGRVHPMEHTWAGPADESQAMTSMGWELVEGVPAGSK